MCFRITETVISYSDLSSHYFYNIISIYIYIYILFFYTVFLHLCLTKHQVGISRASVQTPRLNVCVEQGSTPRELPPWMKFLLGKLGNPSTPLNIRLFVAKLLINTEEVDAPTHRSHRYQSPSSVLSAYCA